MVQVKAKAFGAYLTPLTNPLGEVGERIVHRVDAELVHGESPSARTDEHEQHDKKASRTLRFLHDRTPNG